jgi:gluconate kinase
LKDFIVIRGVHIPKTPTESPSKKTSTREKIFNDVQPKVFLVIGVPGAGKSWVCEQLKDQFQYVHHDGFIGHIKQPEVYANAVIDTARTTTRPLLCEAPFSISKIRDPLVQAGCDVVPVFIVENAEVVSQRYRIREGKPIPQGHLTRMQTYAARAKEWGSFVGTSAEVLRHLQNEYRKLVNIVEIDGEEKFERGKERY